MNNPFLRERIESRFSQTASRQDLSLEHYQNLEQQEQEYNMFLNFDVPKKTERHGTATVTTFIGGPSGGPGSNLIGKVFTIDEAFIAAGGFGK